MKHITIQIQITKLGLVPGIQYGVIYSFSLCQMKPMIDSAMNPGLITKYITKPIQRFAKGLEDFAFKINSPR